MRLSQWRHDLKIKQQEHTRIRLIFWLLTIFFAIILGRAFYLQVTQHEYLSRLAKVRNTQLKSIPVQKGSILTVDDETLAISVPVFSIYADPSEIDDPATYAALVNDIIPLGASYLEELLRTPGKFVWLKRFAKERQKEAIAKLNLRGVSYVRDFERIYPAQGYLSNILGFSSSYGQGLEGMEHKFDDYLSDSTPRANIWDWLYGPIVAQTSGGNIKLTIDDRYQHAVEQELATAVISSGAKSGLVIVIKSKTGAVVAAGNYPTLNPNIYGLYSKKQALNPFVGGIYEPGSTFKIITLAVALDNKYINADATFDCHQGQYSFFGQEINDTTPLGIVDLSEIIKKSSNICAAQIGLSMPSQSFYEGIKDFGFLQATNIAMLGESSGQLRPPGKWRKIDQAILSYGHGIGVTPLQMIAAINVIATDGIYITPYLIEEISGNRNHKIATGKGKSRRVVSKKSARLVKSYMEDVVSNQGTARSAQITGVKVAGKTGTTRKFDLTLKRYLELDYILSFIGFFPADDPEFTVLTILDDPKVAIANHKPAVTLLFRKITQRILDISQPIAGKTLTFQENAKYDPLFE